jgi:anhydro-N-acetylmuramic acid kinase
MEYKVIGLMSGTSMDGLDIAFCHFRFESGTWSWSVLHAETIPYTEEWANRLSGLSDGSALDFARTDHEYGHLLGKLCREFISKYNIRADFIASHGHTIFHKPGEGYTSQVGNGAAIKAETGLPVVCDFRSGDVALGGQGAPLVPAGDRLLFADYDVCLNLGGFANISYENQGERIAYDICPVNIVLNALALKTGKPYDNNGEMASRGQVDQSLFINLNRLPYYFQSPPKSLGKEWVKANIWPLLDSSGLQVEDILSTFCTHIAFQISLSTGNDKRNILISGGGALNKYLISLLQSSIKAELIIPDFLTLNFKEAIIFAFLGVLRWRNENNCIRSVTGARWDHSSGAAY